MKIFFLFLGLFSIYSANEIYYDESNAFFRNQAFIQEYFKKPLHTLQNLYITFEVISIKKVENTKEKLFSINENPAQAYRQGKIRT